MNLKNPSTLRNVTAFVCAICVAGLVSIAAFFQDSKRKNTPAPPDISIEKQVLAMPECAFKSNLLTVLGAHYGSSSEELNQILQAYSKMKIEEMSKDKSL